VATVIADKWLEFVLRGLQQPTQNLPVVSVERSRQQQRLAITPYGLSLPHSLSQQLSDVHKGDYQPVDLLCMVAHAKAHLMHSPFFQPVGKFKHLSLAVISLLEDERVERLINQDIEGISAVFTSRMDMQQALSIGGVETQLAKMSVCLNRRHNVFEDYWCGKALDMFEQALLSCGGFDALREVGSILANDLGQMRYRFDHTKYAVWPAYRDDNSILWTDASAEQKVQESVSHSRTTSPLEPELLPKEEKLIFYYDEWNAQTQNLNKAFVTVNHLGLLPASALKRVPLRAAQTAYLKSRQRRAIRGEFKLSVDSGEQLWLDKAIERHIDLRCKISPDENIFLQWQRQQLSAGVMVLIDASESANDRIAGSFMSILDLEKKAITYLADFFQSARIPFAVSSFHSNTKDDVSITLHKDFVSPWTDTQRRALQGLQAAYSTRLGAALRHMSSLCANRLQQPMVLVLTDGVPSDVDCPEENYLWQDSQFAVAQLRQEGVSVICLKIGSLQGQICQKIFGLSHTVVCEADKIELAMRNVLKKIRKSFT
jgi:nitric oxide reductase NorD protein